ncbi:MAG: hypothetical protein WBA22_00835 [Candidatus Methanofastidiosia archaeon]
MKFTINKASYCDGTNVECLTSSSYWEGSPSWSPDGKKIAFQSSREGNDCIYAMNADGTNVRRLTDGIPPDKQPSWSPDGTHIAYASFAGESFEIFAMGADGSNKTNEFVPSLEVWVQISPEI